MLENLHNSLWQPSKFQRLSRLGSVTARHYGSGRQPNFVALKRGRHLYVAGRPSRWALAHILVLSIFFFFFFPRLFSAVAEWMRIILLHMHVALVRISNACVKCAA